MGLFSTVLGGVKASSGGGAWPADDDRWYDGAVSSMSNAGRRVTPDGAMRVSAAYACIGLLSKTVATLPLRMYRKEPATGKTYEAPNHPLNDLLEYQPNSWQSAWDFKAMMMMHLALRGNAYAEIVSGPRGFADSLEPIHPDRVLVDRLPDQTIRYTVSDPVKGTRRLLQDEVFHVRSHIAPGGLVGISPVTYARETIGLALAAEEHGARMFSNGARPSGVVTVEKTMSDAAFDRFKAQWNASFGGIHNAMKTPILEQGAKFDPISLDAEEAQFIQTREFQIEEIARWFDVPLVLLHHMTKTSSWGTGVEAIMLAFVRNNLMPWLGCWTGAIRRDLILAPNIYEAQFDVEPLIKGDSRALADFYSRTVLNGILTRNEARAALGYNPIDGLDEPLVPTNTTTSQDVPRGDGQPPNGSALIGHNGGPKIEDTTEQADAN
ncbi:phage portal protein [Mesorhizobium sp. B2-6-1]|uniref:phage portal protein n=1 Tax=Mesorhizobium sp. B2-6-1 TaxID=2589916 RepID=UPI001126AA75|nr:phage portal protein [Mesorhizobium sp. B2-6-1]TPJ60833.1 phage portal protein [Mesorhizobium sp. B2-6-1]